MSRAEAFAAALARMAFTDSEGDEIARVWVEEGTPYLALIAVTKLPLSDAAALGKWLVSMTRRTKRATP